MRYLLLLAFALLPQQPSIRFVAMDDYVREILARDWDAHKNDEPMLERGYCLGWQYDVWAGEKAYRVTEISAPDSVRAQESQISFTCEGKFPGHMAELHVHPASTCITGAGDCFPGGPYAFQCLPSDADIRYLTRSGLPFAMIQCSREGVVYHTPLEPGGFAGRLQWSH